MVSVNPNGTGNVLIFPYYTANGGWSTLFNIINTSEDFLALKVRFREQENSRDVLDFNVVMSPEDVWTGWVAEGPNGPRFFTKDMSCTSPVLPKMGNGAAYADFSKVAYTGSSNDSGSTGIERAAEGHLEVYVMGSRSGGSGSGGGNYAPGGNPMYPATYWADHEHMDCSIVDQNFRVNSGDGDPAVTPSESRNAAGGASQSALAGNPGARDDLPYSSFAPLKGNVSYINTGRGVGAGSTALHIEGFGPSPNNGNLVTAQAYPYFLEPTLASNMALWGWYIPSNAIGASSAINEWSVNPLVGARTDWVVGFPTKYLHVDIFDDLQAGVNLARLGSAVGYEICTESGGKYDCGSGLQDTLVEALQDADLLDDVLGPFTEPFADGQSCDEVAYSLWDREENGVRSSGTSISPAPAVPSEALCYETNVLTFGGAESVLNSRLGQTIDTSGLVSDASAGWMKISFEVSSNNNSCEVGKGTCISPGCTCFYSGKPVAGFALKERDFGDPNKNYGQLMDHAYERGTESF